jgi:hypothetical protein
MSPEFSWIIVTLDTMEAKKTEQENCVNKSSDLKAASFSTTSRKHAIIFPFLIKILHKCDLQKVE